MIREITMFEFDEFAKKHNLNNPYQTSNYAILKAEDGYDYDYLGYFDNSTLVAATLIIYKRITISTKYAYAPRGFLLDYSNVSLLENFTNAIKEYLDKKRFIFLKIDPLLVMKQYNPKTKNVIYYQPNNIIQTFIDLGYKKLKDNLYFESQLPRFDAIVNLKDFSYKNMSKPTRNKVNNATKKGLSLIKGDREDLEKIYNFIKYNSHKPFKYFNDLYRIYSNNDMVDIFVVKLDYEKVMNQVKKNYEEELVINSRLNELLKNNPSNTNYNKKMQSDKRLVNYKNEIMEASRKYSDNELVEYIAGAIVIKNVNKVSIVASGYNKAYKRYNPNYFLFYNLINYYQDSYDLIELNGLTGDFTHDNKYYGLNEFKMGFNPFVIEYIGELDLVINDKTYNNLLITGKLHKEFDLK